jgi:hypothetical protein
MLTAVEFDNQAPLDTAKIGKIMTNPMLSAEFEAGQALSSKVASEFLLCGGGLGAQPSAMRAWAVSVRIHNRAPLRRADKGPPLGA